MNSLRKYYEKHPKFRNGMDVIGAKINSLGVIYWICAAIFISTVALSLFLRLPEELKIPVTAIVSTILTTLIIPFILNNTKIKNEHKNKLYERNLPFYTELTSKVIDVLQTTEQTEQRQKIVVLANFIAEQYSYICINLSIRQMDLLFNLKDECLMFFDANNHTKASINNIYNNAERFLSEIRKQGNISGTAYLNKKMVERLDIPELGNMNPPSI
ncbi:hypothetical protein [Ruminococcus sp.]|uniref:hypothetical protein n=1 Tax=Ruminococcus sp. TaxID=41978 RepID=UPI0025E52DFF|nr:hypothetical protein [Ruminococcus sp.]MCR4638973.1 hypothetical protein [Ruminococcus sp.]